MDHIAEELNCPICFERFTSPRSLNNCLHTFCEECLYKTFASFEKSDTGAGRRCKELPCPVCRKTVAVPRSGVTKQWVKQFPVNHVVNSLLRSSLRAPDSVTEPSEGPKCEPCSDRNQNASVQAVNVCVECQEFMCQPCSQHHKYFKSTKAHGVVSVNDLKSEKKEPTVKVKENESKVLECQEHGDKCVELFCVDHNVPVCAICVATEHRPCKDIVQLKVHAESSEAVATTKEKKKKLKAMQKTLITNLKHMLQNKEDISTQEADIKKAMAQKRGEVLSMLNLYESQVLDEFKCLREKKLNKLNDGIGKSKQLLSAMKTSTMAIANAGSKAATYATLVGMESQFAQYESMMAKDYSEVHNEKVAVVDRYPLACFLGAKSLGFAEMKKYAPTVSHATTDKVKDWYDEVTIAPVVHLKSKTEPEAIAAQKVTQVTAEGSKSGATRKHPSPVEFTYLREHELQTSARGPLTDSVEDSDDEGETLAFGFDGNARSSGHNTAAQNGTQATQPSTASGNTATTHQPRGARRKPVSWADLANFVSFGEERRSRHSSSPALASDSYHGNDGFRNELAQFVRHPNSHQLYVANIPLTMLEEELGDFFEAYGRVQAVVIKECEGEATRNYGFVTFDGPEPVQEILEDQPIYMNGHRLQVGKKKRSKPAK